MAWCLIKHSDNLIRCICVINYAFFILRIR
jgi:hypothetical protein